MTAGTRQGNTHFQALQAEFHAIRRQLLRTRRMDKKIELLKRIHEILVAMNGDIVELEVQILSNQSEVEAIVESICMQRST